MVLMKDSGCSVVKSQDQLGNAGLMTIPCPFNARSVLLCVAASVVAQPYTGPERRHAQTQDLPIPDSGTQLPPL